MRLQHLILFQLLIVTSIYSQSENKLLVDGDSHYLNNNYQEAESSYRKAKLKESSLEVNHNLGNTTYMQERYEEAIEYYMTASKKTNDKEASSDIFYNLGNAYFGGQDIEKAIEAYKQAIRLNPANKEAKYNLAVCKEILKNMQQQEQQNQENSEGENEDKEEQENEEQSDQENDQQENSEDQENEQESEQKQDSTQQAQEASFDSTRLEKQTLDSLDAMKLLQIIQNEEQKVQENMRKYNSNRKKPNKDW